MAFNKPNKRRVFITQDKFKYFKLFSFVQEEEGSIYCHWPNFKETKWHALSESGEQLKIHTTDTPSDSLKLSLHRSGVVKFTQTKSFDPHRVEGYQLLNLEKKEISPRHLFTSYISKPNDESKNSPFGARTSDSPIYTQSLNPFVLMFFAIPQQTTPLKIRFMGMFSENDTEENLNENTGHGLFSLGYHDILWVAYRTKHMNNWPVHNHVLFHDGFKVPAVFGKETDPETKSVTIDMALQTPHYKLTGDNFEIQLPFL